MFLSVSVEHLDQPISAVFRAQPEMTFLRFISGSSVISNGHFCDDTKRLSESASLGVDWLKASEGISL